MQAAARIRRRPVQHNKRCSSCTLSSWGLQAAAQDSPGGADGACAVQGGSEQCLRASEAATTERAGG